jgi:Tol biopolymer transport system component
MIAFQSYDERSCRIRIRPALGGAVRTVAPCEWEVLSQFDWLPDGSGIITSSAREDQSEGIRLMVHSLDGAERPLEYPRARSDHDLTPRYSPDGRRLAFRRGRNPYSDLYIMDVDQPESLTRLTHLDTTIDGYAWLPDSTALVAAMDHEGAPALFVVDVATGDIQPMGISPAIRPDIARNGSTMVYEVPRQTWHIARLEPNGAKIKASTLMSSTANDLFPAMAPDGNRIVFISDRTGDWQLWLRDFKRDRSVPLTRLSAARPKLPDWHPDGQSIAFIAQIETAPQAFSIDVESGRLALLSPPGFVAVRVMYAPDGSPMLVGRLGDAEGLFTTDASGNWTLRAEGARYARIDGTTGTLYFNYNEKPGIFMLSPEGKPERLPLQAIERREVGWHIEDSHIIYQSMQYTGDVLRRFDLRTHSDVPMSDTLLPAFNKGTTTPDREGRRYAAYIAHDSSDIAVVDLRPRVTSASALVNPYRPGVIAATGD